jgi:hypothetical protein
MGGEMADDTLFELTADDLLLHSFESLETFGLHGAGLHGAPQLSPEEAMLSPSMRRLPLSCMHAALLSPASLHKRKRTDSLRDSLSLSAARTERLSVLQLGATPSTGGRALPGSADRLFASALEPSSAVKTPRGPSRSLFSAARPAGTPDSDLSSPTTNTTSPLAHSGPGAANLLCAIRSRPFRTITIRPAPASPALGAPSPQTARALSLDGATTSSAGGGGLRSGGSVAISLNSHIDRLSVLTPGGKAHAAGYGGGALLGRDVEMGDARRAGSLAASDELLPISMYDELLLGGAGCEHRAAATAAGAQQQPPATEADKENAADALSDERAAATSALLAVAAAGTPRAAEPSGSRREGAGAEPRRGRPRELLQASQIVAIESDYQRRNQECAREREREGGMREGGGGARPSK